MTIEHQLPASFIASAQYLGSHGVHLFSRGAVNLCTEPVTFNPADGDCFRTLDPYYPAGNPFGSVDYKSDIGASNYNGLRLVTRASLQKTVSLSRLGTPGRTRSTMGQSAEENRPDPRM